MTSRYTSYGYNETPCQIQIWTYLDATKLSESMEHLYFIISKENGDDNILDRNLCFHVRKDRLK